MNIKQIKELAQLLKQNDLSSLEFQEGDTRIRLERSVTSTAAPAAAVSPSVTVSAETIPVVSEDVFSASDAVKNDPGIDFNSVTDIRSPLVGVFYSAPSPDAQPFVKVGSKVKKGDVLCIVEAMKLMNEIQAEQDGEIIDVCVRNGDIVEFGQTLFKLF